MTESQSNLWITFEYRAVEDREASIKKRRVIYQQKEYYKIFLPGGNEVREGFVTDSIRKRFSKAYSRWQAVQEAPQTGTDLKYWAMMPIHVQYEARALGIKTIEALANAVLDEKDTPTLCYYQRKAMDWLYQNESSQSLKDEIKRLKHTLKQVKLQALSLKHASLCYFLFQIMTFTKVNSVQKITRS